MLDLRSEDDVRLHEAIVKDFSRHWELNDEAHREPHFQEVFLTAREINDTLQLGIPEYQMLLVAYFHDLFAWSRFNHHILSHAFVDTGDWWKFHFLNPVERGEVAEACFQHRASYKGVFTCRLSELMNSADRERPSNVETMLKRAIQYRLGKNPDATVDSVYSESLKHLWEKFGPNGYARYPEMYLKVYGEKVSQIRKAIDIAYHADQGKSRA